LAEIVMQFARERAEGIFLRADELLGEFVLS